MRILAGNLIPSGASVIPGAVQRTRPDAARLGAQHEYAPPFAPLEAVLIIVTRCLDGRYDLRNAHERENDEYQGESHRN
jgi:hypothetical protein